MCLLRAQKLWDAAASGDLTVPLFFHPYCRIKVEVIIGSRTPRTSGGLIHELTLMQCS